MVKTAKAIAVQSENFFECGVALGKVKVETDSNGNVTIYLPMREQSEVVRLAFRTLAETLYENGQMSERKAYAMTEKMCYKLHIKAVMQALAERVKDHSPDF